MTESTLTRKGQTTVPQPIRNALQAESGCRLAWHVLPDGSVMVRAKSASLQSLVGMLKAPAGRHVSVDQMQP
jgi:antitoxin PrlF